MLGAGQFRDLIKVYERVETQTPTGSTSTFGQVAEWRGQCTELSAVARAAYGSIESKVTHEIKMRGTPDFGLGRTEFEFGDLRLKPLAPPRHPGHRRRPVTLIPCEDISQNRGQNGSGS
jgi:hypothetical protein